MKNHENTQNTMNIFHMIHYSLEISSLVTWSLQTALPTSDCHHSAQPIPAVAASPQPALANPRAAAIGAGDRGCDCHVSWKNMALVVKYPAAQA